MSKVVLVEDDLDEYIPEEEVTSTSKWKTLDQINKPNTATRPTNTTTANNWSKPGLRTAEEIKQENILKRKLEEDEFKMLKDGENAETIYRDRTGRIRSTHPEEKIRQDKQGQEVKEKEDRIGKVQKQEKQKRLDEVIKMRDEKFSRSKDDEEYNSFRKEKKYWDDPLKNSKNSKSKTKNKPVYKGQAPVNRFNIQPGYRWDGVDRSNGFENRWFDAKYEKEAKSKRAYEWATEDM